MDKYSEELKSLLKKCEYEAKKLKLHKIDTTCFLLSVLSSNTELKKLLNSYGITYNKVKNEIRSENYSFVPYFDTNFKKIIESSFIKIKEHNIDELNTLQLFLTILDYKKDKICLIIKKYTQNVNLMYKDITKLNSSNKNSLIYELGTNLNDIVISNSFNKVYNRENEINRIIEVLARKNKNNPLLIGEAGVGKTAIIEELARRIVNKEVPDFLLNKKIVCINISTIIAGTKYRGEFEDKLNKIIKELENSDDIIIFIDEVHTLIGAGGAEGAIDASNILKPALARNSIKLIGATTINEYKKYIEKDKAFDRRLQKILIEEPSKASVINILEKIKKEYEKFHDVSISNDIIKDLVYLSNKYILDKKEPDRSIDILDEVCAFSNIKNYSKKNKIINNKIKKLIAIKNNFLKIKNFNEATRVKKEIIELEKSLHKNNTIKVTNEDLKYIIEKKTNQKVLDNNNEIQALKNMKANIIGQDHIIDSLIEINSINKLNDRLTSILLCGSNGVGKTECVKEYAKTLNLNLIKLNMSEYTNEMDINKIIGSPKGYVGYEDENNTFESLKLYTNSVILFDEIEKAHPRMMNLLYTILDEGKITNNKNEEINFSNSLIFITSKNNVKNEIGFSKASISNVEYINNELQNRINYMLEFKKLNRKSIKKIILNNIKKINKQFNTSYTLTEEEINSIIDESNYNIWGAKKINIILKRYLEYKLIKI